MDGRGEATIEDLYKVSGKAEIVGGEIVLMAALVYHSLNGLRVIAMDFWPATTAWYRPVTYAVIIGTIVAMIPLGLIMITPYAPWNGR